MSQKTRKEVLVRLRRFYVKAGPKYKQQLLDQAVQLLGYHRKAAIRALRAKAPPEGPGTVPADLFSLGRVFYELSTGHDRQK